MAFKVKTRLMKKKTVSEQLRMGMTIKKNIVQVGGRVDKESGKKKRIVGKRGKKLGLK